MWRNFQGYSIDGEISNPRDRVSGVGFNMFRSCAVGVSTIATENPQKISPKVLSYFYRHASYNTQNTQNTLKTQVVLRCEAG